MATDPSNKGIRTFQEVTLIFGPMFRWLALIFWLIPLALNAQTDPAVKATEIAWGVMGGRQSSLKTRIVQDSVMAIGNPDLPDAYVITFEPAGFVVVSANKTGPLVLGYSLTSSFPDNPGHPLRQWLIPSYQSSGALLIQRMKGLSLQYSTDHIVLPLTSACWGQGNPWNRYCPADSMGKRSLVGCVAVAMSQIMEKWQWPLKGTGEVSYTPMHHPEYGEITAIFDTTRYHWDQTHDVYPTEASEMILYHTGAASFMNYDTALSSTSVDRFAVPALIKNFSYNPGMIFREMEGNQPGEWIRMLHQELDNSRPVLYSGTSPDGKSSHAFNIDGYRDEIYFHFNWGWNGAGDGWYTLAGMAGGGADFSSQQGAIFGIQPDVMPLHDRPSSLDALAGDGFVQLFWDQPVLADFSHFIIYRDGVEIGETGSTSFRDENVTNGNLYSYSVTAWYQGELPNESIRTPAVSAIPWIQIQPAYFQDFESGLAGWQLENSASGFQVGSAAGFRIGGNAGTVAAILSEGHPPGEQVSGYLVSPAVYPARYSHPAISFDYMFRQNAGIDNLLLMWRNFISGRWEVLAKLDSTGGYPDWKNLHFYLPEITDNIPIQIAFYYNDSFGQGYGAAIDNFTVYEVAQPAIPRFTFDQTDLCLAQTVLFTDQSEGSIQTWEWDFGEGAEPRLATTQGPHQVTYTSAGKKMVKLSLNHLDHLLLPHAISVRDKPVAGIEYYRKFQDIFFTDKSAHAEQLLWMFGDGTSSTQADPVHTYYTKNLFEVKQVAYNGTCLPDTVTVSIDMRSGTGIDEAEALNSLTVFPNPTSGKVSLLWNTLSENPINIRVLSITGQVFMMREYPSLPELTLDLSDFPEGIYILQIASGRLIRNEQLMKINN